jgi:phosphatidate cytidylyltransferase
MADSERGEGKDERPARPQNEGVRIIGAEEAAAALEKGEAEGRRPEDAPRFGDVPPAPTGDRPVHRFPLPDTVDPTTVRPSVAPRRPIGDIGEPAASDEAHAHAEALWAAAGTSGDPTPPPPEVQQATGSTPDLSLPEEGLNVSSSSSPEMPHWTEPPTGEVPRVLGGGDDESDGWAGVSSRGPRWRDSSDDWDEDFDVAELADDQLRVGALDETRTEHSDLYDFDEPAPSGATPTAAAADVDAPEVEEAPPATRIRTRARPAKEPRERTRPPVGGGPPSDEPDVLVRVLTAVAVGIVALIAFSRGTGGTAVLATIVVVAAAFELFTVLRRDGYLPAIPIALLATVSIMLGAYWKGERAIPLVIAITFITTMLWYLFGVVSARPTINVMATMGAFLWVGLLGSFASLILVSAPSHHGQGILLAAVFATIAFDVGSFVAGRLVGQHPLMPAISPNKTWEGLLGGLTGSLVISVLVGNSIAPWTIKRALLLGLVVAVAAPLGDLCESMIKRDLGLKDMGGILPGHGGVLDRFDGMLFVLPATYYLAQYLNIH